MNNLVSKYFGKTEFDKHFNALVCYDKHILINEEKIRIDLWFNQDDKIKDTHIKKVDFFLDNINGHIKNTKTEIKKSFNQDGEVKEYIEHHLDELDSNDLKKLGINNGMTKNEKMECLFSNIKLERIGFYPTKSITDEFAVFDFTIGEDYTNYLIAVAIKRKGKIIDIDMES